MHSLLLQLDKMTHISKNKFETLNWLPVKDRFNQIILNNKLSYYQNYYNYHFANYLFVITIIINYHQYYLLFIIMNCHQYYLLVYIILVYKLFLLPLKLLLTPFLLYLLFHFFYGPQ